MTNNATYGRKAASKTKGMTQVALFAALIVLMSFTPFLGYIPLGFTRATIIHIPVIIGSLLLGPKKGAGLGFVFGLTSFINNTINPTVTSFVFTPFYSFSPQFHGSPASLVVAIVPRILIGLAAGFLYRALKTRMKGKNAPLFICGFAGSMVNTIGVMSLICLFFGEQYALAGGKDPSLVIQLILGIIAINGIPEAIIGAILTQAVGRALLVVIKNTSR